MQHTSETPIPPPRPRKRFKKCHYSKSTAFQFLPLLPDDVVREILFYLVPSDKWRLGRCPVCGRIHRRMLPFLQTIAPLLFVSKDWRSTITGFTQRLQALFYIQSKDVEDLVQFGAIVPIPKVTCFSLDACLASGKKNITTCTHMYQCLDSISCLSISLDRFKFDATTLDTLIQTFKNLTHFSMQLEDDTHLGPLFRDNQLQHFQVSYSGSLAQMWSKPYHDSIFNLTHSRLSLKTLEIYHTSSQSSHTSTIKSKYKNKNCLKVDSAHLPDLSIFPSLEAVSLDFPNSSTFLLSSLYPLKSLRVLRVPSRELDLHSISHLHMLQHLVLNVTTYDIDDDSYLDFDRDHQVTALSDFAACMIQLDRNKAQLPKMINAIELVFAPRDEDVAEKHLKPVVRNCSHRIKVNVVIASQFPNMVQFLNNTDQYIPVEGSGDEDYGQEEEEGDDGDDDQYDEDESHSDSQIDIYELEFQQFYAYADADDADAAAIEDKIEDDDQKWKYDIYGDNEDALEAQNNDTRDDHFKFYGGDYGSL